jgi:hypothetical protein
MASREHFLKGRSWPILTLGFGTLVLLTVLFGLDALRRAQKIYQDVLATHEAQAQTDRVLRQIKSELFSSGIFARDFLLDRSEITTPLYRDELREARSAMAGALAELEKSGMAADKQLLERLRREVDSYWDSLDPIFNWTPSQKMAFSSAFLRNQILPRRRALVIMADEF